VRQTRKLIARIGSTDEAKREGVFATEDFEAAEVEGVELMVFQY